MSIFLLVGLGALVLIVIISIWSTDPPTEALGVDAEEQAEVEADKDLEPPAPHVPTEDETHHGNEMENT